MMSNQAEFPIETMARSMGVSRSGFYAWQSREPSARDVADRELTELIRQIHAASRESYGAPRIHAELADSGVGVRVFLNCPYLTPVTPVDDPHYAGSFTFFVGAEHSEHGNLSFAVDLTNTIRRLALEDTFQSDQLNVQLVPLTYDGRIYDGAIEIGEIEIASV